MDLLPNSEQQQIADSVTAFLSGEAPVARLLDKNRPTAPAERALWPRYAELGWFGLGLPEALGGVGYSTPEDILLFRELGRFLVSPNVLAARMGAEIAARTDNGELAGQILTGKTVVAIANPAGRCRVGLHGYGRFHLFDAQPGDVLLAWNDAGAALFPYDAFEPVEAIAGLDEAVRLNVGELRDGAARAWVPASDHPLPTLAMILVSAMLCGAAEATRDSAVAYANLREQFGRKIGSFQAVKHRCADMAIAAEAAWAQTIMGALTYGQAAQAFEAAAAQLVTVDAATGNAVANIQIHGGLGFAAECDAHLFLKRARLLEQLGGAPRRHRAKLVA